MIWLVAEGDVFRTAQDLEVFADFDALRMKIEPWRVENEEGAAFMPDGRIWRLRCTDADERDCRPEEIACDRTRLRALLRAALADPAAPSPPAGASAEAPAADFLAASTPPPGRPARLFAHFR